MAAAAAALLQPRKLKAKRFFENLERLRDTFKVADLGKAMCGGLASALSDDDKAKRELVETRNRAEQIAYSTRKSLEEHGDKVEAEVRAEIESAISNLEEKIKGVEAKLAAARRGGRRTRTDAYL